MMAFLSDPKNYEMIKEDLRLRRVREYHHKLAKDKTL
jgi:hypothetical protein